MQKLPWDECHWTLPTISQKWFRYMAWCQQATSLKSPLGVTDPQLINTNMYMPWRHLSFAPTLNVPSLMLTICFYSQTVYPTTYTPYHYVCSVMKHQHFFLKFEIFTHIFQGCLTDSEGSFMIVLVPMKKKWQNMGKNDFINAQHNINHTHLMACTVLYVLSLLK